MQTTARKIQETETALSHHLAIKDSFLADTDWKVKRSKLETELFNLKVKFYDLQINQLEEKKAYLIKEHKKVTA